MNIILSDAQSRQSLLPLTYTRPVGNLRLGILTIDQKWEQYAQHKVSFLTASYLQGKFPLSAHPESNVVVNGGLCPSPALLTALENLPLNHVLVREDDFLAAHLSGKDVGLSDWSTLTAVPFMESVTMVKHTWDLFAMNGDAIAADYALLTTGRKSAPISATNTLIGDQVFLEEGAQVEGAILNSTSGPIYVGHNAQIMEGCLVRGGLALGAHATLKMGAKVYGPTTIGPHCKAGGEISNSIMYGYSN